MSHKKRLVSGIQTSGELHIGNYLGSICNWLKLQNDYESYFFLADLHSITVPQDPKILKENIIHTASVYLACGVDPEKTAIFCQSNVHPHAELCWIFNCIAQIGWLNRMTQFKEKAGKNRESASVGLYDYPVLMAADILLYQVDIVPVGDDQKQHLELTRDIAGAFNRYVGKEYFKLPEAYIMGTTTRVMSLRDGTKKMSKSDPSDYSRINLTDTADMIKSKMQKAKSDSIPEIYYNKEERPDVANLINIFASLADKTVEQVVAEYGSAGFAKFKNDLADITIEKIAPIGIKIAEYKKDPAYVFSVLKQGKEKALKAAEKTVQDAKELMGFVNL